MADSGSVRTIRWKHHKAGDHSLCRRCSALRDPVVELAEVPPEVDLDPRAELVATAARLSAAHKADPANAIIARELRLTLLVIPERDASDPFAELHAMASRVS